MRQLKPWSRRSADGPLRRVAGIRQRKLQRCLKLKPCGGGKGERGTTGTPSRSVRTARCAAADDRGVRAAVGVGEEAASVVGSAVSGVSDGLEVFVAVIEEIRIETELSAVGTMTAEATAVISLVVATKNTSVATGMTTASKFPDTAEVSIVRSGTAESMSAILNEARIMHLAAKSSEKKPMVPTETVIATTASRAAEEVGTETKNMESLTTDLLSSATTVGCGLNRTAQPRRVRRYWPLTRNAWLRSCSFVRWQNVVGRLQPAS
mmetsp:Transcript_24149/g.60303  ORF Transcript_24149/g.60303 Transcript_24149/m.60303 type:complete len:265 (+) Transcript_24149:1344-2138(+)